MRMAWKVVHDSSRLRTHSCVSQNIQEQKRVQGRMRKRGWNRKAGSGKGREKKDGRRGKKRKMRRKKNKNNKDEIMKYKRRMREWK